ncbi:Epoxyqueuosine reductase [Methanoculleus chikugoensis]|uniref:Epoxyqueuosine reductase n=1 Tax=Methanoculleus chikugoensis TaxID=118126 RepID=A0A1M4MLU6_9EURY|nr:4Fe-4S binding protein [Methanoculleus chikugoensis]SCL75768.1 Epoxyqueuosine reductase [Methanoculleus chikugoensis]
MTENAYTNQLHQIAVVMGADLFGVADVRNFEDPEYAGNNPREIMEDARSVIVLGVAVPRGSIESLPRGRAEYTNTLMAGTATLRVIAFRLARLIEKEGYKATIVPTEGSEFGYWYADRETLMADMSIKYAAYCAGLGNYGINHLLITDEFGPRVRMTAIVTDAPLKGPEGPLRPLLNEDCKNCMKCVEACPAAAFTADGEIRRERCAEYMFQPLGSSGAASVSGYARSEGVILEGFLHFRVGKSSAFIGSAGLHGPGTTG